MAKKKKKYAQRYTGFTEGRCITSVSCAHCGERLGYSELAAMTHAENHPKCKRSRHGRRVIPVVIDIKGFDEE